MSDQLAHSSALGKATRLAMVRRLGLLDAPATESFDRLTHLAARLIGTPVALAVLVDADREFFVSQVGLSEPWASRRETPLSQSFSQHVVASGEPLIVTDARHDELFNANLAIQNSGVVAYAGVPLVCDGETAGSFCVTDSAPREWTDEEIAVLGDLAAAAMSELSLRLADAEQRTAMQRVAASEQRYRSLLAAMSDGVVLQEADGAITACNEAAERMLGLTADQMMGRTSTDPRWRAVHEDGSEFPGETHPAMQTLRTGEPMRGVVMGVHTPDGELTWLSVATEPLRNDDQSGLSVVCTFTDITHQRHAAAERERHAREQEALRAVATLMAGEAAPRAVFAAAAEHVARVLDAAGSAVVRMEPDGGARLVGGWTCPSLPAMAIGEQFELYGESATAVAMRTRRPTSITRYVHTPSILCGGQPIATGAGIAAPIEVDGRFWGTVSVAWDHETHLDEQASAALERFADLLSLAVTGAEAREQLSRLASTDYLTGLSNQRAFTDRLDEEVHRSHRHDRPLSLIVLDVDHFKLVNDARGHDVGNRVLAEFAQRLIGLRRGGDILARVGGEEFAWILPETDGPAALLAAERVRAIIADTPFAGVGLLTTSVGICSLEHANDARDLYRRADLALYWAKANGRNTTFRYTPESVSKLSGDEHARRLEAAKTLAAVRALAAAVDSKDPSTQRHSERVAQLAGELAAAAGWAPARVALLSDAALVHDVGKIGVPDRILFTPGPLSGEEFEQVKTHASLGAEMLADLLDSEQILWIRHHHERYDGRGYPDRLHATEIPDGARLLAVAEAWDAMTVARPYGAPRALTDAIHEMRRGSGTQFSADAVLTLLTLHNQGQTAPPQVLSLSGRTRSHERFPQ